MTSMNNYSFHILLALSLVDNLIFNICTRNQAEDSNIVGLANTMSTILSL